MSEQFRVGDVLTVSCPFTESEVAELRPGYAAIKWPWHRVDPDTPQFRWNGQRAISTDPTHVDWKHELFRTEPAPRHLKVGMVCRVGIPLTVVHVIGIAAFDPPQKNGTLPRPSLLLGVLPAGQTEEPGYEDQGSSINPDDDIPIDIELLFRPYAFLEYDDQLTDREGRSWRFDGPWRWHCEDDGAAPAPEWPLTLTDRYGELDLADASAIHEATETGSHATEVARWSRLTDATPPSHVING